MTVEFYTTDAVLGSTVANSYRDDLKNAGKGNGVHAYSFTVPNELKGGFNKNPIFQSQPRPDTDSVDVWTGLRFFGVFR